MTAIDMMSEDRADLRLLSLANEKGKFAIQIGLPLDESLQMAFERGIDHEWFSLVDLGPVAHSPGTVFRIFRLTTRGELRLKLLRAPLTTPPT